MNAVKRFFNGFKRGTKDFGQIVGLIVNSVLLSIVYIFGVGLTSIIAKIKKKHFMEMELSKESKTYWNDLNLKKRPINEYYRQF